MILQNEISLYRHHKNGIAFESSFQALRLRIGNIFVKTWTNFLSIPIPWTQIYGFNNIVDTIDLSHYVKNCFWPIMSSASISRRKSDLG